MDMMDAIPYRCPWCGDNQTFLSLTQLKKHLTREHSYISGSHSRVKVFKHLASKTPDRSSQILQSCAEDGRNIEKQLRQDKENELNNKAQRHGSYQSFYTSSPIVPGSSSHETHRSHVIPKSPIYVPVLPFNDKHMLPPFVPPSRIPVTSQIHGIPVTSQIHGVPVTSQIHGVPVTSQIHGVPKSSVYVPVLPFHDNHLKDTLNTLSENLSMSRSSQWRTEDMLYNTDNVLSGIQTSAHQHHVEHSHLTDQLKAELAAKDTELSRLHDDLNRLRQAEDNSRNDRRKVVEKSVQFSYEPDSKENQLNRKNKQLRNIQRENTEKGTQEIIHTEPEPDYDSVSRHFQNSPVDPEPDYESCVSNNLNSEGDPELHNNLLAKEQELEEMNSQMRQTQSTAMKKLQAKDKQLEKARARSDKLEQDRELLLHQMKDLLSKANINNKQLKTELKEKDKQLKKFNSELNNAKVDQKELMLETFELYRQADGSLAKLKEMLTLRDCQLKVAKEKLAQFESSNKHLQFEVEMKAQQVEETESIMKTTLRTTQQQLETVQTKLQAEMSSKLQMSAEKMAVEEQLKQKDMTQDQLKHELEVKEQELKHAKKDLATLQSFLGSAAEKETVARGELETFISELINRVKTAEKEARALKRRIDSSQENLTLSDDITQDNGIRNIPVTIHQTLTETRLSTKMSPSFSSPRTRNLSVTSSNQSLSSITDSEDCRSVSKNDSFTNTKHLVKVENVEKDSNKKSISGVQSSPSVCANTTRVSNVVQDVTFKCDPTQSVSVREVSQIQSNIRNKDVTSKCDPTQQRVTVREVSQIQSNIRNKSNKPLSSMIERKQSDVKTSATQTSRPECPALTDEQSGISKDVYVVDDRQNPAKDIHTQNKDDLLCNSHEHGASKSVNYSSVNYPETNTEQNGFYLGSKVPLSYDSSVNVLADSLLSKESKVLEKESSECLHCKSDTRQTTCDRSDDTKRPAASQISKASKILDKEPLCSHCKSLTRHANSESCDNFNVLTDSRLSKDSMVTDKQTLTCPHCKLPTSHSLGDVNFAEEYVQMKDSPINSVKNTLDKASCSQGPDLPSFSNPQQTCVVKRSSNCAPSSSSTFEACQAAESVNPISATSLCVSCSRPVSHTMHRYDNTKISTYIQPGHNEHRQVLYNECDGSIHTCIKDGKPAIYNASQSLRMVSVDQNYVMSSTNHRHEISGYPQSQRYLAHHASKCPNDGLLPTLEKEQMYKTNSIGHGLSETYPNDTAYPATSVCQNSLQPKIYSDQLRPSRDTCNHCIDKQEGANTLSPSQATSNPYAGSSIHTLQSLQTSSNPEARSPVNTLSPSQATSNPYAGSSVHTLQSLQTSSNPEARSPVNTLSPSQATSNPYAGSSVHTLQSLQTSSNPEARYPVNTLSPRQVSSVQNTGSSVHTLSPPQASSTPNPVTFLPHGQSVCKPGHQVKTSDELSASLNPLHNKESVSSLPQHLSSKMLPYAPDELDDDFSDYFALPNSTSYQSDKVHSEILTPNLLSLKHNQQPVRQSLQNRSPLYIPVNGRYTSASDSPQNQGPTVTDKRTQILSQNYPGGAVERQYMTPYHKERYSTGTVINPRGLTVNPAKYYQYQDERYHQLQRLPYSAEVYSNQSAVLLQNPPRGLQHLSPQGYLSNADRQNPSRGLQHLSAQGYLSNADRQNPSRGLQHLSAQGYVSNADRFEMFSPIWQSEGPLESGAEFRTLATTHRRPRSNAGQMDGSSTRSKSGSINADAYRSRSKLSDHTPLHGVTQYIDNVDTESEVSDGLWDGGHDGDFSDSLQLSVDEDGIMWGEETDLRSLPDDLYRQSPSGSETAGDVGSSLLSGSTSLHKFVSDPDFTKRRSSNTGSLSFLDDVTEEDEDSFSALPAPRRYSKRDAVSVRDKLMKFLEEDSKSAKSASTKQNKDDGVSVRDKLMKYLDEDSYNLAHGKRKTVSHKTDSKRKIVSDRSGTSYMKGRTNDYNSNYKEMRNEKHYSTDDTINCDTYNVGRPSKQGISASKENISVPKTSVEARVVQNTSSSHYSAGYDNDQETSSEMSSSSYTPVRKSSKPREAGIGGFSVDDSQAYKIKEKAAVDSREQGFVSTQRHESNVMPLSSKYDRTDREFCVNTSSSKTWCSGDAKDSVLRTHSNPDDSNPAEKDLAKSSETSEKQENFYGLVNKPAMKNSLDKSDIKTSRLSNVDRTDVLPIRSGDYYKSQVDAKDEPTGENNLLDSKSVTGQNGARSVSGANSDYHNLMKTDKNKMVEKQVAGESQLSWVSVQDTESLPDASKVNGMISKSDVKNSHLLPSDKDRESISDVPILKDNLSNDNADVKADSSLLDNSDKTYIVSKFPATNNKAAHSSEDATYFQSVPLKPARQLNDTVASTTLSSEDETSGQLNREESTDFDLESDLEKFSSSFQLMPAKTHDYKSGLPNKEESTDFDLESDLEKVISRHKLNPSGSLGSRSKTRKKKVLTQKRVQQNKMSSSLKVHPRTGDESSTECLSDSSKSTQKQEGRKRRVALFSIFKFLDTKSLSQVGRVCKEWKQVSRHPSLWKNVHLKNERISSSFLATISHWCTQLQSLTLEGLRGRDRDQDENYEEYQRKTRGSLEPGMEQLLKACQNSLKSLHIVDCSNILTDKSLWLASCYSRLLQKLKYVSSTDPVTAEVLWALVGGCPGVTSLVIPPLFPCQKPKAFNNKCLLLVGKFYRDLLELGVGGHEIDINGLLPLVQGCQRLQFLSLDHMKELNDDNATALCRAGLNNLSVLELNGTPATPKAIQVMYKCCRHLKKILILLSFVDCYDDSTSKKQRKEYSKKIQTLQIQSVVVVSELPSWNGINRHILPPNSTSDRKPLRFFKQVQGSNVFFLSAIANTNRPNRGDTNVIVSAMDGARIPITCCMIIDGNRIFSTPSQIFSEHHHIDFLPKLLEYFYPTPFATKQFICVIPGVKHVTNISLTLSRCSYDVSDYIPVIYPKAVPGGLAICAKTAYENGPVPENFIEWVEIQKILGVDKILLFDLGVPEKLKRLFRYYQDQGILDIVPYELPGVVKGVPVRGMSIEMRLNPQFSHDENLPVYECRERLAGYTYVAGIDMDEVILPHANQGLKQFMQDYLRKFPDAAGFQFYVQFHLTSWGKHTSDSNIFFFQYQKSTPPRWECQKYIYLPERTELVYTHRIDAKSSFTSYILSPEDAILHHYRTCPHGWSSCFPDSIIDKEMLRFSDILQQKINIVHKHLGWK